MDRLKNNPSYFTKAGINIAAEQHSSADIIQTPDIQVQNSLIKLVNLICLTYPSWIWENSDILRSLVAIWDSEEFSCRHQASFMASEVLWTEVELLVECLVTAFNEETETNPKTKLLFSLIRVFHAGYLTSGALVMKNFLADGLKKFNIAMRRKVFSEFTEIFEDESLNHESKAKFITMVITPLFRDSMKDESVDDLIGEKPNPESDSKTNLLNIFLTKLVIAEKVYPDCVRIAILQLACVFVEFCASHIHDAVSKRQQGQKMRKLMGFAWPCLLNKACVDPSTKYHGHLLLAHIIAKFPINKKIVLQVTFN